MEENYEVVWEEIGWDVPTNHAPVEASTRNARRRLAKAQGVPSQKDIWLKEMAFKRLVDLTLKKSAPIGSEELYEQILDTLAEMSERKDMTLKESAEYLVMELQVEAYEGGKEE